MKYIVAVILLISLLVNVTVAAKILIDYRYMLQNITAENVCKQEGLFCNGCSEVVNCRKNDKGEFEQELFEMCRKPATCQNNACTYEMNPTCLIFTCSSVGMFPDPIDCKKYHVCYKDEDGQFQSYDGTCNGNFGYDMISTYCKTALPNGCPNVPPVPICKQSGSMGALQNKSLYYVCGIVNDLLYPFIFECPNGKTFNGKKCADSHPPQFT